MTKVASWLGQGLVTLGIAALVVSVLLVPQHQLLADEDPGGGYVWPCFGCANTCRLTSVPPVPPIAGVPCTGAGAICLTNLGCISCTCNYSILFGCNCR